MPKVTEIKSKSDKGRAFVSEDKGKTILFTVESSPLITAFLNKFRRQKKPIKISENLEILEK